MPLFSWTPALATGVELIDDDHRVLIDWLNVVLKAISKGRANGLISKALSDLVTYTQEHFAREEQEMQRIDYQDMDAHKAEHAQLLLQVNEMKARLDAGNKIDPMALYNFLTRWLKNHILHVDMKLAKALQEANCATS